MFIHVENFKFEFIQNTDELENVLNDALIPLNPMLQPNLIIDHSPSAGLTLTGRIAGLSRWYEEEKLLDHGLDWPDTAIKLELMEIIYLYFTRVYHVDRCKHPLDQFYGVVPLCQNSCRLQQLEF